jgi:hypothetical protein
MSAIEKALKSLLPRLEKAVHTEARKLLRKEIQPLIELTKSSNGAAGLLKPCPVTGIMNSHRRFSYLMPEARTAENLAKYRSDHKKALLSKSAKKLAAKAVEAKPAPTPVAPIVRKAKK